jgi:hypothetical protein
MSTLKRKLKGKKPPEGWELIEEVIEDFERKQKENVNEEHEGKRKAELTWKIQRTHWEKNRFIYDLMYQRKVMSKELVSPVHLAQHARGIQCIQCCLEQHQWHACTRLPPSKGWLWPQACSSLQHNRTSVKQHVFKQHVFF